MAGYLGAIPVPQATQHRESFTATSGQTTFNTAGYTVGFLDVYLNGSHLSPADFTATNGSDVVLASGASADDVCDIISYTAFEVNSQTFTGTTTMDVAAITGVLTTTAATVFNGGFASNANSTIGGNLALSAASANVDVSDTGTSHASQDFLTNSNAARTTIGVERSSGGGLFVGSSGYAAVFGSAGAHSTQIASNNTVRMTVDSSGNVGIGTSSPSSLLHLEDDTPIITLRDTSSYSAGTGPYIQFQGLDSGSTNRVFGQIYGLSNGSNSGDLAFYTRDSGSTAERMRLDSSGRLLVGKTSGTIGQTGTVIYGGSNEGLIESTRDGAHVMKLNRLSSDGDIAVFAKAGTTVGSIATLSSQLYIGSSATSDAYLRFGNSVVRPCASDGANRDNAIDLGASGARFDDIFATNGTIQTSDRNEKQDIAALTSAEMLVAKRISALFKTFRWKDKVVAKGNDARTHSGIIAQDVQSAFTAEGLDAGDYSLFISSTWWEHDVDVPAVEAADAVDAVYREVTDSDGMVTNELVTSAKEAVEAVDAYTRTDTYVTEDEAPEGATSKTRMGIRYPELLSFVAAYNEQRFAAIETRLTALEG